ncbi:hypothetical protein RB601_006894 [Gaeumannomyces tritici]
MVLHNPNNWHWVNKDVGPWAKQWFEDNLTKLEVEDGGVSAKISKVVSMDGDVDVSQRKGKVITIFDVKLALEYSGECRNSRNSSRPFAPRLLFCCVPRLLFVAINRTARLRPVTFARHPIGTTADEVYVTGGITVPEVAHDTDEDEFVFDIDIHADAKEKQPVKDLVRSKLVPKLRAEFLKLAPALINEHGKDIQHAPGSNPSSGFSTPKVHGQATPSPLAGASSSAAASQSGAVVNTTTVTDNEEFRTTADELYKTFTDPQRLAAFTREPPRVFEGARPGGKFELFGGNVAGEYKELDEPKSIVQSWRLNQWPAGHFSTLRIEFDQNDVEHVTVMRVTWSGVPVGQEDVTKRNWGEYYVRSIKRTFGFGTIL